MAPPSTPTPRRFLAPKRTATQSATPKPLAGGTQQQFQATPRFSLPSTPRDAAAPAATTPAPPSAVFSRQRREPISDIIDSSPPPPPSRRFRDSIEVDSLPPSSLVPSSSSSSQWGGEEDADPPSPKRRRLSTSVPPVRDDVSIVSSLPDERDDEDQDTPVPDAPETPGGEDLTPVGEAPARAPPPQPQPQPPQPTFHPAPRFKPADAAAAAAAEGAAPHEPLPDVFSPRRRGETFVPGGLAAGLRDWLMDLEAATGAKRDGEWAARVFVERVRAGAGGGGGGMRLVHGRCMRGGDGGGGGGAGKPNDDDEKDDDTPARWTRLVLAGDGRLTGLARRNEVTVGAVLGIAKPVWEVGLGREGRWLMACDWKVL